MRAFTLIRESFSEVEIAQLIFTRLIDDVVEAAFSEATLKRALAPVSDEIVRGVTSSARSFGKDIPRPGIAFDQLSPDVITGIRTLDSRVITTISTEVRETVRQAIKRGIEAGESPRAIARGLRDVVGLAPNQANAVANFRGLLEIGDREALSRKLRDKRFDATLKSGKTLTPEQIDRMTSAYQRRMVNWHAETVSRTTALDAQRLGQRISWKQAIDQGIVDNRLLMKRRIVTLDGRERPEHHAMNGQVRRFDEPYSNGEMVSGDLSWNCRCVDQYFVATPAFLAEHGLAA